MPSFRMDRRTMLRGMGGIAVGLPLLEVMGLGTARAATSPGRFLISYGGTSLRGEGGSGSGPLPELLPDTVGRGYDVKRALKSLTDLNIRDDVSLVSGLTVPWSTADGKPIPPGGRSRFFHYNTIGPQVSGMAGPTGRDATPRGATADQIVATAIAGSTPQKVLLYRVQADGEGGNADRMSFKAGKAGQEPTSSPHLAYQSLFSGFTPPAGGGGPSAADLKKTQFLLKRHKSVLDFVQADATSLVPRLGAADRARVQQHLDEIRALEMRLDSMPVGAAVGSSCSLPKAPGTDPPTGGEYSEQRGDLLSDLIAMAFACDLSRVAAFMITGWKCYMNAKSFTGINADVHALTHGSGPPSSVSDSVSWHVKQWGKVVAKLKSLPEGSGSVLDNTALVMLFEGGYGFDPEGNANNTAHATENMIALVGGRAGGLKSGQHVSAKGKHPAQAVISAMNAAGVMTGALGDVSGNIPELFS